MSPRARRPASVRRAREKVGDLATLTVHRPVERRCVVDAVAHVQSRAALDEQPHDRLAVRPHRLMQRRGVRMKALGLYWLGSTPASSRSCATRSCPCMHASVRAARKRSASADGSSRAVSPSRPSPAAAATSPTRPSRAARARAVSRKPKASAVSTAAFQRRPRRLERGAAVHEQLGERQLQPRLGRRRARDEHAQCRALRVVHVRERVRIGAGIEQKASDVDRVRRRALTPSLDAVRGDVVQQRGVMPARRARAGERGILAQQCLQHVVVASDDRVDRGLEAHDAAIERGALRERGQIRPALERVRPGRHELRVLEVERRRSDLTDLRVAEARMLPLEPPRRRLVAGVQIGEQRLRLVEIGAGRGGEGKRREVGHRPPVRTDALLGAVTTTMAPRCAPGPNVCTASSDLTKWIDTMSSQLTR